MGAAVIEIAPARRREKNRKELRSAAELELRLTTLQAEFRSPALREILEAAICAAHRVATGSRKRDRDDVFNAIEPRGCRTIEEICDETGLVEKVVRRILDEFTENQLVERRAAEGTGSDGGRPEYEYWPRHTHPDSPFFIINRK